MTKAQIKRQVEEDCSESYNGARIAERIWLIASVRKALTVAASSTELDDEEQCGLVMAAVGEAVFQEANKTGSSAANKPHKEPQTSENASVSGVAPMGPNTTPSRIVVRDLYQEEDRLSPSGLAAGNAAGHFIAWNLERDGFVKQFREEALHGKLFAPDYQGIESAWRFITSPLVKLLSYEDFRHLDLAPRDTKGRILLEPSNEFSKNAAAYNHMQGYVTRSDYRKDRWGRESHFLDFSIEVDGLDGFQHHLTVSHTSRSYKCIGFPPYLPAMSDSPGIQEVETAYATEPMEVPWLDGRIRVSQPGAEWQWQERPFVEGYGLSVVNECLGILNYLVASYPVEIWQLLRFILTGTGIYVPPILASAFDYDPTLYLRSEQDEGAFESAAAFSAGGPITLHVQPWVQPEELAEYWRQCRFRTDAGRMLPSEVNLEIFRFVLKHTPPGEVFQWQNLATLWNAETGQGKTRASLRNAFLKTRSDLFPSYELGKPSDVTA